MSDSSVQAQFEKWNAPECPFTIEYRLGLMQELRAAVAYGQQALTRGGVEVGGVLLGTRSNQGISIHTWRPINCEHAEGPAFALSDRDRQELKRFLDEMAAMPSLAGFQPVGWFLSHTRSEISLREPDLLLYREFFPDPLDVSLVLRPGRRGAARAGFFFRDSTGAIQIDHAHLEFNIEGELAWPAPASQPAAAQIEALARPELPPMEPRQLVPSEQQRFTSKRSWRWAALPVAAMVAIGWLYFTRNRGADPAVIPIEMSVTDHAGQLAIAWDHSRPEMRLVRVGELSIVDGAALVRFPLTAAEAQVGSCTFERKSGDVQVSLRLEGPARPLGAFARYLGSPPAPPVTQPAGKGDLERLRAENADLRSEVSRAKTKADQAETVIRVLRERLNAAESQPKQ